MGSFTISHALTSALLIAGFTVLLVWLHRVLIGRRRLAQHTITSILQSTSTPGYRQSLARIRDELARARRYERALAVVVFRLNGVESSDGLTDTEPRSFDHLKKCKKGEVDSHTIDFLVRSCVIGGFVRRSDIITYDEKNNQIAIVLPETDKMRAASAVQRFKSGLGKRFTDRLCVGISEFPKDGFDIEQLVMHAAVFADDADMSDKVEAN